VSEADTSEKRLRDALSDLIDAIANADRAGCIDHIDCWDNSEELWYGPLDRAAKILLETEK
jgi:hypothetical protein